MIIKEEEKLPDDEVLEEIEPEKKEKTEGENAEAEAAEEPKKLKIRNPWNPSAKRLLM